VTKGTPYCFIYIIIHLRTSVSYIHRVQSYLIWQYIMYIVYYVYMSAYMTTTDFQAGTYTMCTMYRVSRKIGRAVPRSRRASRARVQRAGTPLAHSPAAGPFLDPAATDPSHSRKCAHALITWYNTIYDGTPCWIVIRWSYAVRTTRRSLAPFTGTRILKPQCLGRISAGGFRRRSVFLEHDLETASS